MSKQSEAKKTQNYRKELNRCGNCKNFISEKIINEWGYEELKNKRCSIGGFAVMVNSTCDKWHG